MPLISHNPFTNKQNASFEEDSEQVVQHKLNNAESAFLSWKNTSSEERGKLLISLAMKLIEHKEEAARLIAMEIGQPVKAAISEIEKCALTAEYYEGKIGEFLKDEITETDGADVAIKHEPLGPILGISPWNFPFWMAFRFIIPTISAGNTVLLKHSSNVPQSAKMIEQIMNEAGFPEGVFNLLFISSSKVEAVIRNDIVKGVSFAGGDNAGSKVASIAASEIKKTLLELGGNDAFIVLEDADVDSVAKAYIDARLRNAGQACNSPKRLYVHEKIYTEFKENLIEKLKDVKIGDPQDMSTEMGPLASESGLEEVERQIDESVKMGATVLIGGKRINGEGFLYEPTILEDVTSEMPVVKEEVFGPVVPIMKFSTLEEVVDLTNQSKYGLGVSIWTKNSENAKRIINDLETGNVFVNQPVRSDPRFPYGGSKKSGYGRELSHYGIKEFTNIKTVVIKK